MLTGYLAVPIMFMWMLVFPGILLKQYFRSLGGFSGFIYAIGISLSFWICVTWFLSLVHAPLDICYLALLGLFVAYARYRYKGFFSFAALSSFIKRQPLSRWVLLLVVLLYLFPFAFMSIPPGADITMHGYITRLIIDNQGLPQTYDPIIPNSHFGSYSAGYQALTAMTCVFNHSFMRLAINLISVSVYPFALLSLIFLFHQFVSERTAIYAGIITFMANSSLQSTIGWGGNPTMLAFAFCLLCFGAVIHAVRNADVIVFRSSAFILAAIPLVHAIPALTFVYLSIPAFALLLWFNRDKMLWIITNTAITGVLTVVLLLPFILHFQNENSPELLSMIKRWQMEMMHNTLTDSLLKNIVAVAGEIVVRVGRPLVIAFILSMACLVFFKLYKETIVILGFALVIFLLILNCNYWVIPFSEILYPERVAFFMIVLMGIPLALSIEKLSSAKLSFTLSGKMIPAVYFFVLLMLGIGIDKCWNAYTLSILRNNKIHCDKGTMAAFEWISNNTLEEEVMRCTYADAGMWIPAFANRPTIGAHLHFIHEVTHVNDTLENRPGAKYIFVTARDVKEQTPILSLTKDKNIVFQNEAVTIYH